MRRHAAIAGLLLLTAGPAGAQDLILHREYGGVVAGGQFAVALAVVGDMDGDGFAEFAVGASADSTPAPGAGRVFVYRGGPARLGDPPAWVIDGRMGDLLGAALAPAGDLDADGFTDFLAGAPGSPDLVPGAPGAVFVVFGSDPLGARSPAILQGPIASGRFGAAVAGLGAFDGDARPDFAVGAPGAHGGAGLVAVYRGVSGAPPFALWAILHGRAKGDAFGSAVAGVGDMAGDAATDLVIGAPFDSEAKLWGGRVWLHLGSASPDTVSDRVWAGAAAGDLFGYSLAGAGDVDGDGRADLLVGAPGANTVTLLDAGAAFLYLGAETAPPAPVITMLGARARDELGMAVAGIGDLNGDGWADFAVGAPGGADPSFTGEAQVFLGQSIPIEVPDFVLRGEAPDDQFGRALSNGGAVAAARYSMFLAGAYRHAPGGRAYLYGSPLATVAVPPPVPKPGRRQEVRLLPPWPVPARGAVRLALELESARTVDLAVLDVGGRRVATLARGGLPPGRSEFRWPDAGAAAPAGVYWVVLRGDGISVSRRFVLLGAGG